MNANMTPAQRKAYRYAMEYIKNDFTHGGRSPVELGFIHDISIRPGRYLYHVKVVRPNTNGVLDTTYVINNMKVEGQCHNRLTSRPQASAKHGKQRSRWR